MESRIESGNYEVIESKMVLLDEPCAELRINLVIDNEPYGKIKLHFKNIATESSSSFSAKVENGDLIAECVNFNGALGTGTAIPVDIGSYQGKSLRMHIWSYLLGNGSIRKVEYTIYREL